MQEILTLFLWVFWQDFENQTYYLGTSYPGNTV
jgi:hypothetical protein